MSSVRVAAATIQPPRLDARDEAPAATGVAVGAGAGSGWRGAFDAAVRGGDMPLVHHNLAATATAVEDQAGAPTIASAGSAAVDSGAVATLRTKATSWQLGKSGQRTHSFQILWGSSALSITR